MIREINRIRQASNGSNVAVFSILVLAIAVGCNDNDASRLNVQSGDSTDRTSSPGDTALVEQYWQLDNLEQVGGHAVTVAGNPTIIDTPHGKAIEFDGIDDGLFLDVHPVAGMSEFTAEVTFRPDANGEHEQRFLHMQESASASRVMFETRLPQSGKWFLDTYLRTGEVGVPLYAEDHVHETGEWYHAAIVVADGQFSHYVNGELELTAPFAYVPQGPGRTSFGVRINEVSWFKGAIRSARFTSRALAPDAFMSADD